MEPLASSFTKMPKEKRCRLIKSARRDAYMRDGKLKYWLTYGAVLSVIAALMGVSTGIIMSIFFGSPSGVTVGVAVAALVSVLNVGERIERRRLRNYISRQLRSTTR